MANGNWGLDKRKTWTTRPCYEMISCASSTFLYVFFKKDFMYLFSRGGVREKENERNINVLLPLMYPLLGTWPSTQECALTGNWTRDPVVHRLVLNPLSHTSQAFLYVLWVESLNIFVVNCLVKYVCIVNSFGKEKQILLLEKRTDSFTVQNNQDSASLQVKS